MKIYQIKRTQLLPIRLEEAWEFFSTPMNLQQLMPPTMRLTSVYPPANKMYEGMISIFQLQPFPLVKCTWATEITHIESYVRFIDEQRFGPFRFWHHEHKIKERNSGVEIIDIVHYALPFYWIGEIVHRLFINKAIEDLFSYRHHKLKEIFCSD